MIYLILTAVIWGFAFVAQVVAAGTVPMFTFNTLRYALGTTTLIPVVLFFEKKHFFKNAVKKTVLPAMLAGAILFIASSLQQYGIELTHSAGEASFLTGLYTVLVPIFGIFLGRRPSLFAAGGAILAVTGLYLVSVQGAFSISLGHGILLISACFWAWHIIVLDKFASDCPPILFSCFQFAFSGILSLPCMLALESVAWSDISAASPSLLFAGVLSTGVAFTMQMVGQKRVESSTAAVVLSSESVFGVIGGALILEEVMSVRAYVGCALMFCGILLSQYNGRKKL